MNKLQEQVNQAIRRHRLLGRGQPLLVAVSGGVDSMVLLQILSGLVKKQGWQLTIAHLNHQLRGRSSKADERLVRRAAARLRLPLIVERAAVRAFARTHKLSVEMAARKIRHDFLARTAANLQIGTIALAHHADDQLELFFLRLLRGSGGEGLAGMKWRSPSPSNPALELVRPLLDVPKSALQAYASENRISFREDATNASLDIQRNRIRHELLPLLRQHYQPALHRTISRLMEIIGTESELVTETARRWLQARRGGYKVSSTPFEELPVAVQRRCVQLQLIELGIAPDFELVERLRSGANKAVSIPDPAKRHPLGMAHRNPNRNLGRNLNRNLNPPPPTETRLPPPGILRGPDGLLKLTHQAPDRFQPGAIELALDAAPGKHAFDGVTIQWQVTRRKPVSRPGAGPEREIFDADRVGSPIRLRHWQAGDRFQPMGLARPVKLQDLFTNLKVNRLLRRQLLVGATARGELFWVEGLRMSERFKLEKSSIRCLQWSWKRL